MWKPFRDTLYRCKRRKCYVLFCLPACGFGEGPTAETIDLKEMAQTKEKRSFFPSHLTVQAGFGGDSGGQVVGVDFLHVVIQGLRPTAALLSSAWPMAAYRSDSEFSGPGLEVASLTYTCWKGLCCLATIKGERSWQTQCGWTALCLL